MRPTTRLGTAVAMSVSPTASAEFVSWNTRMPAARSVSAEPAVDTNCASHSSVKSRLRKTANADGRGVGAVEAVGSAASTDVTVRASSSWASSRAPPMHPRLPRGRVDSWPPRLPSGHAVYRPLCDAADPCRMRRLQARRGARLGAMDRQLANEALRRCVLFRRVTVEDLERCTSELAHRHYKRGETIFHAGDPGEAMHIVIEGAVKVELPSPNGDTPAILATIEPGGFF